MKPFTNQSLLALVAVVLMSACSRPYATFQKTTPEHFYTKATPATPVDAPAVAVRAPAAPLDAEMVAADVIAPATPATVDADLQKVDALVSAKAGLVTNKKLSRNLNWVKAMVAEVRTKAAAAPSATGLATTPAAPQKMNLMQRLVTKSIDKKIHNKMAPKKTMAKSLLSIGLIVGLIGLLLILVANGSSTVLGLGYVGLIVGIILIIASLL